MKSQQAHTPHYSFEFFPPKTEKGEQRLRDTQTELSALNPAYYSVTFGAGGSTQEKTFETVKSILDRDADAAPHLSCIGQSRESIAALLDQYASIGVKRIVTLRGDLPSGMGGSQTGELNYANELVAFIREHSGDKFHLKVAAYPEFHPQATSAQADLENFKRKVEAGADSAITQYFYNADAYFRFIDDCEAMGIDIPIVPGIMPITNYQQLARFSDMCGAEIPRWIRSRLSDFGDRDDELKTFGTEVVSKLCRQLLDAGAPGLHFYTMNQVGPTKAIWEALEF